MAEDTQELRENSGWLIALGVLEAVLGFLAIASPMVTGVAVAIFAGAFILVTGIIELIGVFKAPGLRAGLLGFLGGVLRIVCGALVLAHPLFGLAFLTLLLAAYFLVEGITRIAFAFKLRPDAGWGWVLFGGIVTLLLAILIWRQWPVSGAWAIGTLVGIHILFNGWARIAIGIAVRR
jgi:uncharacterized membrane protein HdeD (DUF308 family)